MRGIRKSTNRRARRNSASHVRGEALERRLLFAAVTLNGSSGADVIEIQSNGTNVVGKLNFVELFNVPDSSIDGIVVNAGGGNDTIYLDQTGTLNSVTINGGEASDTLYLADLNSQLAGNINGTILYNGGGGTNLLIIDDDGSSVAQTHVFDTDAFATAGQFSMTWTDVDAVTLGAGGGNDIIRFDAGSADTEIYANGHGGDDLFKVGGSDFDGLDLLQSPLTLEGDEAGDDTVQYLDNDLTDSGTLTLTNETVQRNGSALVTYVGMEGFSSFAAKTFQVFVLSTAAATAYSMDTGVNPCTVQLGEDGNVEEIQGPFHVSGGFGSAFVYDDANNTFSDTYTFTSNSITRDFSALVTHVGFTNIQIFASTGSSAINVSSLASFTYYLIDGGGGAGDHIDLLGSNGNDDVSFILSDINVSGNALAHQNVEGLGFDGGGGTDSLVIDRTSVNLLATAKLDEISIDQGTLDMGQHDLLIDYSLPTPIETLSGITGLIASGYGGGAWDGDGLITTTDDAMMGLTSLGVGEASRVLNLNPGQTAAWEGFTVDNTTVIVKYTYAGDSNLDGFISGDDYTAIDFAIAVPGSSAWHNGDFNFDGIISGDDYTVIDFNIVAQDDPL